MAALLLYLVLGLLLEFFLGPCCCAGEGDLPLLDERPLSGVLGLFDLDNDLFQGELRGH